MKKQKQAEVYTLTRTGSVYATLVMVLSCGLVLANFLGAKIWRLGPITLDGGIWVFPAVYVASDLLCELYGRRAANRATGISCVFNTVALLLCLIVKALPGAPGANKVDLGVAFGLSARVMFASVVAFVVSQTYNNAKYEKLRAKTKLNEFWKRALGSSIGAHCIDSAIFVTVAFIGRIGFLATLKLILCAAICGMIVEALMNPIATKILARLRDYLDGKTREVRRTTADDINNLDPEDFKVDND